MKLKITYTFLALLLMLTLLWVVDTILPNYNPDYQPLLAILKVTQAFLSIIMEGVVQ